MVTPVFCCGFECGVNTAGAHWDSTVGNVIATFDGTIVRTGLKSGRCTTTNQTSAFIKSGLTSWTDLVGRFYVYFVSLPSADTPISCAWNLAGLVSPLIWFKQSDSKIYAAVGLTATTASLGASGVSVTAGQLYRIDFHFVINAGGGGDDTSDVMVDGKPCGRATAAGLSIASTLFTLGVLYAVTADIIFEDVILSNTAADYPIGPGYVKSYIPNADGTHNVAGANDFERSLTGTDITNATTDAYTLIDERPLPSTAVDFINGIAPPNPTDYVEWQFEDSAESVAPRAVEGIVVHHDAGGSGTNNWTVELRDSTGIINFGNIWSGTTNVGSTITYKTKNYPDAAGGAWTTTSFNGIRGRFLVSDASPDVYLDAVMLEAEFPGPYAPPPSTLYRPYSIPRIWRRRVRA
jgi:hypothetical protein